MKANRKPRTDEEYKRNGAFTFIVPMTMAIVIGFAMLAIGAYIIGTISSTLEDSFPAAIARSDQENKTIALLGNITEGFSDVVDIEIVVIIITALSMAILAIMAVGSRKQLF